MDIFRKHGRICMCHTRPSAAFLSLFDILSQLLFQYLHLFTKQQPDLNWETEEVRDVIFQEAITFWLEKGVDGFRIDSMYPPPLFCFSLAD